jgi:hypothetical protein
MILFLSVKHTLNNVIIRYIVYDDICLMVRKINYFILFLFINNLQQPFGHAFHQLLGEMQLAQSETTPNKKSSLDDENLCALSQYIWLPAEKDRLPIGLSGRLQL